MNGKGKNAFRAVLIVVVLIFAMCFALAACATGEDVQIEKVTSASEINRLIAKANFSAENAVRDKMEERYGALSDYSYNNGRATADIEKDGKSYSVTVEIEVDESDFSVTRYKNATRSGDSLIYTQNGEEVTYNVADKIVVEENGYFYVIDVSGARSEIDRAVSAAILTEKGGSQEETPGDIENPGTEEPENPTDPENPDPEEPENPGGEDKPDPDEPENPGGGETVEIKYEEYQNFDEFVSDLEGENLDNFQTAVSEALRTGFTPNDLLSLFGRGTTLENTKTYQFAFNFDNSGNVNSVQYVAIKDNAYLSKSTIKLNTPIPLSDISKTTYSGKIEEIVENGELVGIRFAKNDEQEEGVSNKEIRPVENQMLVKEIDGTYSLFDYTRFISMFSEENIGNNVVNNFVQGGSATLTEEKQQYFDLCMQLAVNADAIGENLELAFVTVQGSSSLNDEWGTTYCIEINAINPQNNAKLRYVFVFDDDQKADKLIDRIKSAISREQFSVSGGEESALMSSSDIVFEFDALGNVVTYTTPQESENQA